MIILGSPFDGIKSKTSIWHYPVDQKATMVANSYWSCYNLKDYFFEAINDLQTWDLPQYKKDKVQRAQDIAAKTKEYEEDDMPASAESEIKKNGLTDYVPLACL
jgi:hypothetical protein